MTVPTETPPIGYDTSLVGAPAHEARQVLQSQGGVIAYTCRLVNRSVRPQLQRDLLCRHGASKSSRPELLAAHESAARSEKGSQETGWSIRLYSVHVVLAEMWRHNIMMADIGVTGQGKRAT